MIILNHHNKYNGSCIEFKSPTNNYKISEAQLDMRPGGGTRRKIG